MNRLKKFNYNSKQNNSSERGSTTLVAITITLMISLFSLWFLQIMQLNHILIKKRFETYLCFRFHDQRLKKHIKYMGYSNVLITTAFVASMSPVPAVAAAGRAALEISKYAQQAYVAAYLLRTFKAPHCSSDQNLSYFINYPYERSGLLLARTFDQRAYLKGNTWTNYIYNKPASDRFLLEITYRGEDGESQLKEIPLSAEVQSWKHYYGLP
jgi:hypothetical protein